MAQQKINLNKFHKKKKIASCEITRFGAQMSYSSQMLSFWKVPVSYHLMSSTFQNPSVVRCNAAVKNNILKLQP